jgi:hypothetical protein
MVLFALVEPYRFASPHFDGFALPIAWTLSKCYKPAEFKGEVVRISDGEQGG